MNPNYQHPGYPVSEVILCPACAKRCNAQKHFYAGDAFPSLVHNCEHCGYTITESEWNPTPIQRRPRVRVLRFYTAPKSSALELLAKICLVIFVAGVIVGVVILCLAVLALAAGG